MADRVALQIYYKKSVFGRTIRKFDCVWQAEFILMMLWARLVKQKWMARQVKEADIDKAGRRVFPPKERKIDEIWVELSL